MGEARVSINFSAGKFTDTGLSTKTNSILDKMDGSTVFVTPSPTLKEVDETNQKYIVALGKVENGTKEATVIKNDLRAILEGLLKQLAEYVQTISKGDEATILSSGFDITRKPGAVGMLAKPSNFTVKPGKNKSSVIAGCDKVDSASYYEIEYTERVYSINCVRKGKIIIFTQ